MHSEDLADAEAVEQAVADHGACAGPALLRRLKDHDGRTCEVTGFGEVFGRAQQHRGMAVMAAGVHLARHRRAVRQPGRLIDRESVHVGPQADRPVSGFHGPG